MNRDASEAVVSLALRRKEDGEGGKVWMQRMIYLRGPLAPLAELVTVSEEPEEGDNHEGGEPGEKGASSSDTEVMVEGGSKQTEEPR